MNRICIIPARGGSKRIPGKNHKTFCGVPIILRVVETAISSSLFDKIIVSTDSEIIKNCIDQIQGVIIHSRSEVNSCDYSDIESVCLEVINTYNFKSVIICCFFATAVLINKTILQQAYKLFERNNYCPIASVKQADFKSERLLIKKGSKIFWKDNSYSKTRTQDCEDVFYDAGQFYLSSSDDLLKYHDFINEKTIPFELDKHQSVDIDNEKDWLFAEKIYRLSEE